MAVGRGETSPSPGHAGYDSDADGSDDDTDGDDYDVDDDVDDVDDDAGANDYDANDDGGDDEGQINLSSDSGTEKGGGRVEALVLVTSNNIM